LIEQQAKNMQGQIGRSSRQYRTRSCGTNHLDYPVALSQYISEPTVSAS